MREAVVGTWRSALLEQGRFATAVAIKRIEKESLINEAELAAVRQELILQADLDHPCLLPLLFGEETDNAIILVTPLAIYGDLHEATKFAIIREYDCRNLADQLLNALSYLHGRNILHGDMKPKNVLLRGLDESAAASSCSSVVEDETPCLSCLSRRRLCVQLCDFGLSTRLPIDPATGKQGLVPFHGLRGTSGYFSPEEIQQQDYGSASDLWVVGIMLFKLLAGYEPFYPPAAFEHALEFEDEPWADISSECQDIIRCLLRMSPNERLTAKEALGHPWLRIELPQLQLRAPTEECSMLRPATPTALPFVPYEELIQSLLAKR